MLSEGVIAFNGTFVPIARSNGPTQGRGAPMGARPAEKAVTGDRTHMPPFTLVIGFFSGRVSVDLGPIGKN